MTICNEFQKTTVSSEPQLGNFISVAHAQPNSITAEETKRPVLKTHCSSWSWTKSLKKTPRELEYWKVKNVAQSVAPWYQSHHCWVLCSLLQIIAPVLSTKIRIHSSWILLACTSFPLKELSSRGTAKDCKSVILFLQCGLTIIFVSKMLLVMDYFHAHSLEWVHAMSKSLSLAGVLDDKPFNHKISEDFTCIY